MFSCEFCKISKNTFSTEHLWTTASEIPTKLWLRLFNLREKDFSWLHFTLQFSLLLIIISFVNSNKVQYRWSQSMVFYEQTINKKNHKIHKKELANRVIFFSLAWNFDSIAGLSSEFCKSFQYSYSIEHLWTVASANSQSPVTKAAY